MKRRLLVIIGIIGLIMANCAGTPATTPVQEVQHAYNKIKDDSLVVNNSPEELEEARRAISSVRNAVAQEEDQASVNQLVALAKQRIAIAKKAAELRATRDDVRAMSDELQSLKEEIRQIEQDQIEAGRVNMPVKKRAEYLSNFDVQKTNRGLILRFQGVTFETSKAYLTSQAERPINELAKFLSHYPDRNIRIEGYTDNTGSANFNQQLSQQRANAVRDALISRGIAESRISTAGLGEQYPIASNETDAGRKQNRRVEIVISDENGQIPGRE